MLATILMVLCWAVSVGTALAQATAPLELPNLRLTTDGIVQAIVRQPDGGIVVGGSFEYVKGVPRRNLARLMPDGAIDASWNPSSSLTVASLAVDDAGNVYVGASTGVSWQIGDQMRNGVAKLFGNGLVDPAWHPSVDGGVNAVALGIDGGIYLGGYFTSVDGQARNRVAKVSGAGAVDAQWNPSANGEVNALAVDASGAVYVGGYFTEIGGENRNRVAKLSGSGTGAADPAWDPSAGQRVRALAIGPGGEIYAGGSFTQIGGQARTYLAKLSGTGTGAADPTWNADFQIVSIPSSGVYCLELDATGDVYAGGAYGDVGGQSRNYLAKISGSGAGLVDPDWHPAPTGYVRALIVSEDGTAHVGGSFSQIGALPRSSLAWLDSDGSALLPIDAENPGSVSALAAQPDGGLVVGGRFARVDGAYRPNLLRLQPDRSLDTDWNISSDGEVNAVVSADDGTVYVGGNFTYIGSQYRPYIAKISSDGVLDAGWNPALNGAIQALALDSANGALYIGGNFSQAGGQPRYRLAKISSTGAGGVDPDWSPSLTSASIHALAAGNNGSVYVGGNFTHIGGQSRNHLAKLSASGSGMADPEWNPSPDYRVYALTVDASGAVYVGGEFSQIGGAQRGRLAKVSGSGIGDLDPGWIADHYSGGSTIYSLAFDAEGAIYTGSSFAVAKHSAATGAVYQDWGSLINRHVYGAKALALGASGVVFAGGDFTQIGGQPRIGLAALPPFTPSSDARLSSLTPTAGALAAPFDPEMLAHELLLANNTAAVAFTPVAMDNGATITVNGESVASGTPSSPLPLSIGSNPASILVTAEDGTTVREYTVDVIRLSADPVMLSVTIRRLSDTFAKGGAEVRHYRITATNLGHQSAGHVQLTAPHPAGLTDVLWTCEAPAPCLPTQGDGAAVVEFALGSGQSAHVDLSGEVIDGTAFIDLTAQAGAEAAGISTHASVSEPANGVGVLKNGFEE